MRTLLAGLGGGTGALAAAGVAFALIAAGFWIQSNRRTDEVPQPVVAVVPAPQENKVKPAPTEAVQTPDVSDAEEGAAQPVEEASATVAPAPEESAAEAEDTIAEAASPEPAIPSPIFEEIRREPDGVTVIAGQGAPGAQISVLQDGVEIAKAVADDAGKFATIALIPPDGLGHVLTLLQVTEGKQMPSEGEVILAPIAPPVVVAEADVVEDQTPAPEVSAEPETQIRSEPVAAAENAASATTEPENVEATRSETAEEPVPDVEDVEVATALQPSEQTADEARRTATEPANVQDSPGGIDDVAAAEQEAEENVDKQAAAREIALAPVTTKEGTEDSAATPSEAAEEESDTSTQLAALEPEPTSVAPVLRSTQEGVELLNTPRPEVMDNVAIDTISYTQVGDVQLAGRAQSEAVSVRVYLDNTAIASLEVDAKGRWRGELPDVDEGIYTLRIDEVAADGQVTSRVETPFKREPRETLIAASEAQEGPISAITVQKGATLWAIARDRYGDGLLYVRVFEANRDAIRDPDLIYPGQIFDLPD